MASQPVSPPALQALAADPFWQVRREVAANPSTSPEVLAQLATDDTEAVPVRDDPHLAASGQLQIAVRGFSEQARETVRQRVARNPNTPAAVLIGLAGDGASRVRTYATAQLIWRNFLTVLEKSAPRGLVLVRRPLIQRDEWSVLMPDAAVVGEADVPASRTDRLDPAAVRLAVTIAWPWSRTSLAAAPDPHRMAGIDYLCQIEPEDGPVISVHHLISSAYLQIASARPGQPLTLAVPFPIRVDPADLLPFEGEAGGVGLA